MAGPAPLCRNRAKVTSIVRSVSLKWSMGRVSVTQSQPAASSLGQGFSVAVIGPMLDGDDGLAANTAGAETNADDTSAIESSDAMDRGNGLGQDMVPYCVLDRSYCPGSVKIVLAAGKVTSTIPCTAPAA